MVKFAEDLYSQSHRRVKEGQNYFTDLLKVAERILGKPVPIPANVYGAHIARAKGRGKPMPLKGTQPVAGKAGKGAKPVAPAPVLVKPGAKGSRIVAKTPVKPVVPSKAAAPKGPVAKAAPAKAPVKAPAAPAGKSKARRRTAAR
jgi:hypothetical protein